MVTDNVTPITAHKEPDEARPSQPELLLTERPEETPHRVACVLRYLSWLDETREITLDRQWRDDVRFGRHILFQDLAAALDYAVEHLQLVEEVTP